MALDPNIALQAGTGVAAPPNPLQQLGQVGSIANAFANNKLIGVQTEQAQQGLAATQQRALATIAFSALSLPDDQLVPGLHTALDRAVAAGVLPKEQASRYEAGIAQSQSAEHLRRMITQFGITTLDPQGQFTQIFGTPTSVNVGDAMVSGVQSPARAGGAFIGSGVLPLGTSPEFKGTGVTTVGPDGRPGTIPNSTRVDRFGNPLPQTGAGGAPPAGTLPGAYPAQPAPTTPAPAPAAANPPGFVPTGQPPDFAANQAAYQADQRAIPETNQRLAGLDEARQALEIINSGRSTATLQKIREFLQARGLTADWVDTETNAYTKAKKYMLDYAARSGGRSDQALSAALESNASTDIPNQAALDIVRTNIGQERMAIARVAAHKDTSGAGYLAHSQDYSTKYDRRAFAADLYKPAELEKMVKSMTAPERKKFEDSLEEAVRRGVLKF